MSLCLAKIGWYDGSYTQVAVSVCAELYNFIDSVTYIRERGVIKGDFQGSCMGFSFCDTKYATMEDGDSMLSPYGRTSRMWDSLLVMKSVCVGGRGFAPRPGQ